VGGEKARIIRRSGAKARGIGVAAARIAAVLQRFDGLLVIKARWPAFPLQRMVRSQRFGVDVHRVTAELLACLESATSCYGKHFEKSAVELASQGGSQTIHAK